MKNLTSLVRGSPNYTGEWSAISAAQEFNSLVEAVARATPYHSRLDGLAARCIHCGSKYDPTADPRDNPKHHAPGCVWLWAVELVDLCNTD